MSVQRDFVSDSPNPSPARATHQVLVVRLRGTQAEMGAQHGRITRDVGGYEIGRDYYNDLHERLLADSAGPSLRRRLVSRFGDWAMRRMELHRPKEYLDRTMAFIEAGGDDPELSKKMMVMDFFQNTVGLAGRYHLGPFKRAGARMPACSTLMVWGRDSADGAVRHARNFDMCGIGVWDAQPEVVFCEPEQGLKYGFVTTRGLDCPGITGFNEAGLTMTMHTRFHRDVTFSGAAVVDLGHDIIRRAETLADAAFIARERPVCSTWGIAVSSATQKRGIVIETNGKGWGLLTKPGFASNGRGWGLLAKTRFR